MRSTTTRLFLLWAAALGFLGVGLGAFGAHALSGHFSARPDLEATFRTGTLYHLVHAVALVGVALAAERFPGRWVRLAGIGFAAGVILFSGSLYLLSIFDLRFMGAVAPLGGVALLLGWLSLGVAAWQSSSS